ncbi:MAG: recombinase family protein [Salinibacter sp.]
MKALGYVRVSTQEQAMEGLSVDAQRAKIEAHATAQGMTIVETYVDRGVSASKPLATRSAGSEMLAALAAGDADAVVAIKLDRLFRDSIDALTVTREWDEAGIALHLLDMGGASVDTSSAFGRFFLTVMSGFAEMERNLISERTTAALSYKRDQGEWIGRPPFGYRMDDGELVPDPDAQEIIERIRHDKRYRHLSIRALASKYELPKSTVSEVLKRGNGKTPVSVSE